MAGITGLSGISGAQLQTEFQVRVAVLQKDAAELEGDLALKLIASASIDPAVGQQLSVQI